VTVVLSRGDRSTPDAVFPNNWFSTHSPNEGHPYRLVLYPMTCVSRRSERSADRIHLIKAYCGVTDDNQVLDLSYYEQEGKFLEGTGACVFDRINKICYVGLSKRADAEVAEDLCNHLGYKLITFKTQDETDLPIFHTNVMLNIGNTFAMLCDECFATAEELDAVQNSLSASGRTVIPISLLQVRFFCGNALELRGEKNGEPMFFLTMSQNAWDNLFDWQQSMIREHVDDVIPIPVNTIERIGGGSVRCMIGQLFTS
ncbi:uncharacterized protein LOC142358391, partial [Convolutriloba macropyga]|uniref:uncharacterized protein LOC142358391 n=1 Tax=Convolutriloba macropyga TaxID=536237 RepID=UPI003F52775F